LNANIQLVTSSTPRAFIGANSILPRGHLEEREKAHYPWFFADFLCWFSSTLFGILTLKAQISVNRIAIGTLGEYRNFERVSFV